jgi:hypothetical protein
MSGNFNFRDLANSMVGNGQFHLPPNDVLRQGTVIGYDPNWNGNSHDAPTLSINLAGDEAPVHGIRFVDTYTPNLGDTVWVSMSGEDGFVVSKLADAVNGNDGHRVPTANTVIGHGAFTDTTVISVPNVVTQLNGTAITTQLLPNRIYKAECSFSFNITNAEPSDVFGGTFANNSTTVTLTGLTGASGVGVGASVTADGITGGTTVTAVGTYSAGTQTITLSQNTYKTQSSGTPIIFTASHQLSCGFITPSGFYEMNSRTVNNGTYTASGQTIWSNSNTSGTYPYSWTGTYPNAQFVWYFAAKVSATGGTPPTATGIFQRVVIHDLGIAN